ncbi:lytic transglycosylase domain-containing protein [Desulfogranum mediterraneum]|uniref:lytic transglycosylase domain-containing protein n=1 Tax=Desulfogranum mediterraneum TaxID=160661 RepID=UPI001378D26A|nr:lytic transglycosylase domain-containing protein [Desulfogranum mediterraneum]
MKHPTPAVSRRRCVLAPFGQPVLWAAMTAVLLLSMVPLSQAGQRFPLYPEIQANVSFWKDVYGRYTSRQGILHDRDNLHIVYAVIDLVDWEAPGSGQINRNLIKYARRHLKNILTDLGHGKKATTAQARRIAALFPKQRHTSFLKARDNIRLQIGQQDRFRAGVVRSGKYLQAIKTIFRGYGLPQKLAYLPHVESSFNPQAHSKAGAAGLWQFTRSTGRNYLTIDTVLDERYDPLLASHAAARLLKENHSQLGTWPLALTAYNYGRSGMLRAVKQHHDYVTIFQEYNQGYFKFASRNFYSEFLAATQVAEALAADPTLFPERPEAIITLPLKGYASAQSLRNFFRVSKQDFARLNPALRSSVLQGRKLVPKGYPLRLPGSKRIRLKRSQLKASFYQSRQREGEGSVHLVRRGDTVSSIARRYKTTTKALRQLNRLNRQATIRVGQQLAVPHHPGKIITLKTISKNKP